MKHVQSTRARGTPSFDYFVVGGHGEGLSSNRIAFLPGTGELDGSTCTCASGPCGHLAWHDGQVLGLSVASGSIYHADLGGPLHYSGG